MSTTAPAIFDVGRLDRRITLQAYTEALDEYGQPIKVWSTLADVWAQVDPLRGVERQEAAQRVAAVDTNFRIRWRGDLTAGGNRIIFDGRTYDIRGVAELGRREGLLLEAQWADAPTSGTQRARVPASTVP